MPLKCVLFYDQCHQKFNSASNFKPGFHIVVSVVSVVRKKFIGQIEFPGGDSYMEQTGMLVANFEFNP